MKILHLCLANYFIDGFSYQENMLTKYHKKLGFDVEVIASYINYKENKIQIDENIKSEYINEHQIKIKRIKYRRGRINKILRRFNNLNIQLEESKPDIIFVHGLQFMDIIKVKNYCEKNKNVKLYIDNHADFNNSARNFISKYFLHYFLWKILAKMIEPSTEKFYGVLPARCDFLSNVYKIKKENIELLEMGADTEIINKVYEENKSDFIKKQLNFKEPDFIILTGGKINSNRKEVINLMEAINNIEIKNLKLLIFGSIEEKLKKEFEKNISDKIKFIGWISADEIYKYIYLSDLIVFPGLHSVLWEQSVGMGKPCVFKYIEGFNHIDLGGNCEYLYSGNTNHIQERLEEILFNKNKFEVMKYKANSNAKNKFSYWEIAEKSIKFQRK